MSEFEKNDSNVSLPKNEAVPTMIKQTKVIEQIEEKTAGFWMRLWAFTVDFLIVSAIVGIVVNPIFHFFDWSFSEERWYSPMTIISGLFYYAYFVLTTKYWQQTIGKMIFGLKVKSLHEEKLGWLTVLFREVVGRFISNKLPIIYIMVAFMPSNKGLNDIIADTVVVQEKVFIKRKKEIIQEIAPKDEFDGENSISPIG
ncbi:RDD family protein [Ureibacillus sp. FSL E2-3493]|uniref:RDD family protein n=1 Tax=Ureibacillus sp. FSL E2-3493 TaxID=2921367 RepID=UPI003119C886